MGQGSYESAVSSAQVEALQVHVGGSVERHDGRWALPAHLWGRVRTGCVFESQPADTFGLLVMRTRPHRGMVARIDD